MDQKQRTRSKPFSDRTVLAGFLEGGWLVGTCGKSTEALITSSSID